MKHVFIILIVFVTVSCNDHSKVPSAKTKTNHDSVAVITHVYQHVIPKDTVLSDFTSWYNYTYLNVPLSQDFTGLDVDSTPLDKHDFLNKLITGKTVAFRIGKSESKPVYKLYKLNTENKSISSTIVQLASIEMNNYAMEGRQIPDYDFTDIQGDHYSSASDKGKLVILKCWFIGCTACVNEFPECNEIADQYKNRNDILFISLASDRKSDLEAFLKKKKFDYAVIPGSGNYMVKELHVSAYPTHLLIDQNGKILKVTNSIREMKPFIEKEIQNLQN